MKNSSSAGGQIREKLPFLSIGWLSAGTRPGSGVPSSIYPRNVQAGPQCFLALPAQLSILKHLDNKSSNFSAGFVPQPLLVLPNIPNPHLKPGLLSHKLLQINHLYKSRPLSPFLFSSPLLHIPYSSVFFNLKCPFSPLNS